MGGRGGAVGGEGWLVGERGDWWEGRGSNTYLCGDQKFFGFYNWQSSFRMSLLCILPMLQRLIELPPAAL